MLVMVVSLEGWAAENRSIWWRALDYEMFFLGGRCKSARLHSRTTAIFVRAFRLIVVRGSRARESGQESKVKAAFGFPVLAATSTTGEKDVGFFCR